jgi:LacI family transcriptional regulator
MGSRPTIGDVAREAGVSKTLAGFALNNRKGVSAETKKRILDVAKRMNYNSDPLARALRTGSSNNYAIMVRNMRNPYFLDVLEGAEDTAREQGAVLLAVNSRYSPERELEQVRRLIAQRVGGLAITPIGDGPGIGLWRESRPDLPVVVMNSQSGYGPNVRYVSPDNESAVRQAVDHLAELGHRRISFVMPPAEFGLDSARFSAFSARCAEHGIEGEPLHLSLWFEDVRDAFTRMFESAAPPRAVITSSDYTAQAIYQAARASGVRIGQDFSVIGQDDLPASMLLDPPLTTLGFDRRVIGRAVFERLADVTLTTDHIEPVHLVPRGSTARPPRGS